MDSLIVLRKPLRGSQLEPKFNIPKKSKKAVPKVDPIPPNPHLGEESNEPPISFVKLYRDLCEENSICASSRVHASWPTRMHMCLPTRVNSTSVDIDSVALVDLDVNPMPRAQPHVNTPASSRSDSSLVTHYFRTDDEYYKVFTDVPPPSSARAELILELDYDTISKDSGFY